MKRLRLVTSLVVISVMLLCYGAVASDRDKEFGPVSEGWQLSLTSAKSAYGLGDDIDAVTFCQNVTQDDMQCGTCGAEKDFYIDVRTDAGVIKSKTAYGERVEKTRRIISMNSYMTLKPGEMHTSKLCLSDLYDFSAPGVYLVTIYKNVPKLQDRSGVKLYSNTLRIVVR